MKIGELLLTPLGSSIHIRIIIYWSVGLLLFWVLSDREEVGVEVVIKPQSVVERQMLTLKPPLKQPIRATVSVKKSRRKKGSPVETAVSGRKININRATVNELVTIKGIGPVLAKRIIQYREEKGSFRSVESLRAVKGIGKKRVAKLQEYVTVEK